MLYKVLPIRAFLYLSTFFSIFNNIFIFSFFSIFNNIFHIFQFSLTLSINILYISSLHFL
nr:MAG TPA: hypothetical protein [Crassvirales sp.]